MLKFKLALIINLVLEFWKSLEYPGRYNKNKVLRTNQSAPGILAFLRKKNYFAIFGKISLFANFEAMFCDFISKTVRLQLQQGREQHNFVSVAINSFFRQLPQLQLQQGQKHNLYLLQFQLQRLLKPLTATGTNFAASDPVSAAVYAKKDI